LNFDLNFCLLTFDTMFHSYCIVSQDRQTRTDFISEFLKNLGVHTLDVWEVTDDTITIAQVRELKSFLARKPFASPLKAGVILADGLTPEAQQAILKTLEEPPTQSVVILSVGQLDQLLPTIVSRTTVKTLIGPQVAFKPDSEQLQFWQKLLPGKIGERLLLTNQLAKDRAAIALWLKSQIEFWRWELTATYLTGSSVFKLPPLSLVLILKNLSQSLVLINQNLSLKLVLDHLFLELPAFPDLKSKLS